MDWARPEEESRGNPGNAGIGVILRNSRGSILALFSKDVGVIDSNMVEALAVKKAVVIFSVSTWKGCNFEIESDSANVVKWILNSHEVPWRMRQLFMLITNLLSLLTRGKIRHIPRSTNSEADSLSKRRALRPLDFIWINHDYEPLP
ncbi:Uncharacterized protein TCM_041128 [Theobroma cacao]|uniref:RNase H type-1 domain-containing protein n=1 Tax=Theobroma cacao TaxID=3641 RepID=A0A061GZJ5_THECC|nr:Uncharacterized protein TCM_041128 [Theobroma cacao]